MDRLYMNLIRLNNKSIPSAVQQGYHIDLNGNVFHYSRKLKLFGKPYLCFGIRINKRSVIIRVHRFQAYKKFGDKIFENGIDVRHKNGNPLDNWEDNILIGTRKENISDIPKEKRTQIARDGNFKRRRFTHDQVKNIRTEHTNGVSRWQLQKKYKCGSGTMHQILKRITYSDVV